MTLRYKEAELMTKSQLIDRIAISTKIPKMYVEKTVNATFNEIEKALMKDEDINIMNFGKIYVSESGERKRRNPLTGEEIIVAPKKTIRLKVSRNLKKIINLPK